MRLHWRSVTSNLALAATLAGASTAALAEGPQDRFWAGLEYFYPTISSTARIDAKATARPGSSISLEDELDLEDRKGTPYLSLGTRLGENWRIEFEYYELNREATKAIGRSLNIGDTTFPIGAQLSTRFDSTIYRLTGGWSFYKTQEAEAGVGFGLHITDFETQMSGVGTGILSGTGAQREARDALAPLPTIGLYGTYVLSPQFHVRGRVDYLSLKYNDYDGSLVNWMAAIDWRFHKNVGIGLGYRYVDYKLEADKSDFRGEVQYTFKGPTLFVNVAF